MTSKRIAELRTLTPEHGSLGLWHTVKECLDEIEALRCDIDRLDMQVLRLQADRVLAIGTLLSISLGTSDESTERAADEAIAKLKWEG